MDANPFPKAVQTAISAIQTATIIAFCPAGYAPKIPAAIEAYWRLLKNPDAVRTLRDSIVDSTPTGRLYALLGCYRLDRAVYEVVAPLYRQDTSPIVYLMGCIGFSQIFHPYPRFVMLATGKTLDFRILRVTL